MDEDVSRSQNIFKRNYHCYLIPYIYKTISSRLKASPRKSSFRMSHTMVRRLKFFPSGALNQCRFRVNFRRLMKTRIYGSKKMLICNNVENVGPDQPQSASHEQSEFITNQPEIVDQDVEMRDVLIFVLLIKKNIDYAL
jgi:hypothetical protein